MTVHQSDNRVEMFTLPGIPEITPNSDLGQLVLDSMQRLGASLREGDVLAVAQKVISKAENRFRYLSDIEPSRRAWEISAQSGKDARKVQAILDESTEILRVVDTTPDGLVIARHKCGWVCANAGIDESNIGESDGEKILLLPLNPDASARRLAESIQAATGVRPGVVITDTFGRPWRKGLVNVAIGVDAVAPILNWVGKTDAYGRRLQISQQAYADEIAAASGLLMEKDAATPVVVFRGLRWNATPAASGRDYVRTLEEDLFK
ncbi:hypothetical protein AWV80_32985 [Cupriavidus sp. UYMU48A]|nr:hypothetical protein AWV80_32985 [Cupriavidus sp. UYMU48A]